MRHWIAKGKNRGFRVFVCPSCDNWWITNVNSENALSSPEVWCQNHADGIAMKPVVQLTMDAKQKLQVVPVE